MIKKYIVTYYAAGENYTPSVFATKEEAEEYLCECAGDNLLDSSYGNYFDSSGFFTLEDYYNLLDEASENDEIEIDTCKDDEGYFTSVCIDDPERNGYLLEMHVA